MSEIKTIPSTPKSDDPKVQAQIDKAIEDLEVLTPTLNKMIEMVSAGGVKRVMKGLLTFQDVRFKEQEFELMSVAEHVMRAKLTLMLTAARTEQVLEAQKKLEEQKENEDVESV